MDLEEESIEYSNRNLIGNIVNTSIATQLSEVKAHLRGTSYFDPQDLLAEKLDIHPALLAPMTSSMAWMLDMLAINAARSVMFSLYAERDDAETPLVEYLGQIASDLRHDSMYWSTESDNPQAVLAMLMSLRYQWHATAQGAAAANNRDYTSKSLSELVANEKPLPLKSEHRANLQKLAELEAPKDADKAKFILDALEHSHNMKAKDRVERNKELQAGTIEILRAAQSHAGTWTRNTDPDGIEYVNSPTRFDQLPMRTQRQLMQFIATQVDSKLSDLAVSRMSALEYGTLLSAAFDLKKELKSILATKFSDAAEIESQSSIDGRRADRAQKISMELAAI